MNKNIPVPKIQQLVCSVPRSSLSVVKMKDASQSVSWRYPTYLRHVSAISFKITLFFNRTTWYVYCVPVTLVAWGSVLCFIIQRLQVQAQLHQKEPTSKTIAKSFIWVCSFWQQAYEIHCILVSCTFNTLPQFFLVIGVVVIKASDIFRFHFSWW